MAGRPPKPTALHILQGTYRKDRHSRDEPIPPPGEVLPPAWLSMEARRLWAEMAPTFIAMGVLTTADVTAFANWMEAQAKVVLCLRGNLPLSNDTLKLSKEYAIQFGATPAARAKVHRKTEKPASKLDEFTREKA